MNASREPGREPSAGAEPVLGARDLHRLLGLLTHEMRTPLGAIIGYGELLDEGLLGELPQRALDAVRRIGISGAQLRHLLDGLSDLVLADDETALDLQQVDGTRIAGAAIEAARALASGRSVHLEAEPPAGLPSLLTDPGRLAAVLDLAIGAAVRASPGATLRLSFAAAAGDLDARVEGAALDRRRDFPDTGELVAASTGPGLRLAMARRIAGLLGGTVRLSDGTPAVLSLRIPSLPPDYAGAE